MIEPDIGIRQPPNPQTFAKNSLRTYGAIFTREDEGAFVDVAHLVFRLSALIVELPEVSLTHLSYGEQDDLSDMDQHQRQHDRGRHDMRRQPEFQ